MQILQGSVNFLLSLGAAIFVPFIIIVAGLLVRMRVKDAVSAGITLGVAFSGMTMLISYMTAAITPAAQAMSETVGVDLPITDGGWTTMSTISWSWPYAFLMFPLVIGINIALILLRQTETFNADLWNVWGKIFTAVAVYYITGSVVLAFVIAAVQTVFELKTADFHQYRVETMSGIPGVTITHRMVFLAAPMYPVDWLLRRIPALNRSFNANDLRDKVGIFAENHILGFILGILFGVLARFDVAATLTLGIQAATALTLFPVISKYFMQALEPISNAISEFMQKRFNDRQLFVGLDWPFLGGANEIWLAVIWTIPGDPALLLLPAREQDPPVRGHHQRLHRGGRLLRLQGEHHPDAHPVHHLRPGVPVGRHRLRPVHDRAGQLHQGRRSGRRPAHL